MYHWLWPSRLVAAHRLERSRRATLEPISKDDDDVRIADGSLEARTVEKVEFVRLAQLEQLAENGGSA